MQFNWRESGKKRMKLKYNPYGLIIDQTSLCVQKCYFCYRASSGAESGLLKSKKVPPFLPVDLYKKIIDEAAEIESLTFLSLCGPLGEPLMVRDLVERLEYAKNKNRFQTILINTNGQLLHVHDLAKLLNACTNIQVSVDSIKKETYEKIHCNGDFEKVMQNIETLVDVKKKKPEGAAISIRFTEGEYNRGEWEDFHRFFENKADRVLRRKIHSFMSLHTEYKTEMGPILCNQPYGNINFNVKGEITTCCINWELEPCFGNIRDHSLKELWESKEFEEWRDVRMETTCKDCGGLGGFQQRVDFRPSKEEIIKYKKILKMGEKKYYRRNRQSRLSFNRGLPILKKLFNYGVKKIKRIVTSD